MKKLLFTAVLGLSLAGLMSSASAQVSFTGNYTQNFDSMGTAGTTAPTGWTVFSLSGGHETFSYAGSSATITTSFLMNSTSNAISVGSGTSTLSSQTSTVIAGVPTNQKSGSGYNFGLAATPTDRALGSGPSGNAATELQASFINNTASSISTLDLSYDIRRFTTTTTNNTGYNTNGLEENPGYWLFYSLDGGTSWTNVASLNPTLTGSGGSPAMPNSVGVTSIPLTAFSLGSTWAPGSTLQLRWVDDNAEAPSPDQLIGLDNVNLTTTAVVPEPGSVALIGMALAGWLTMRLRKRRGQPTKGIAGWRVFAGII